MFSEVRGADEPGLHKVVEQNPGTRSDVMDSHQAKEDQPLEICGSILKQTSQIGRLALPGKRTRRHKTIPLQVLDRNLHQIKASRVNQMPLGEIPQTDSGLGQQVIKKVRLADQISWVENPEIEQIPKRDLLNVSKVLKGEFIQVHPEPDREAQGALYRIIKDFRTRGQDP